MNDQPSPPPANALEQLLRRGDVWRGHSQRFVAREVIDTGFEALNPLLLNRGWPRGSLVEICQPAAGHGEWLLFIPALQQLLGNNPQAHAVLLNPPALPFAQGLIQAGVPLSQLLVVQIQQKADFIASFVELARASSCALLLAWQPRQALSYTEMRKCQLATADGTGLYVIFRPRQVLQQSSPAALRLLAETGSAQLQLTLLKQRGQLQQNQAPVTLALPGEWLPQAPHRHLDTRQEPAVAANDRLFTDYQPRRNVLPLSLRAGQGRVRLKRRYQ